MKFHLAFAFFVVFFASACLENDSAPAIDENNNDGNSQLTLTATLLQVDYETLVFEQGYNRYDSIPPYDAALPIDSIPLEAIYNSPGDFGDLTFRFIPETGVGDTLFFGTIIWAGTGDVEQPSSFEPATLFAEVSSNDFLGPPSSFTNLTPFEVFEDIATEADVFGAIQHLELVRNALDSESARFGWFFYPRSVGVGNPAEWDYYVVIVH